MFNKNEKGALWNITQFKAKVSLQIIPNLMQIH